MVSPSLDCQVDFLDQRNARRQAFTGPEQQSSRTDSSVGATWSCSNYRFIATQSSVVRARALVNLSRCWSLGLASCERRL